MFHHWEHPLLNRLLEFKMPMLKNIVSILTRMEMLSRIHLNIQFPVERKKKIIIKVLLAKRYAYLISHVNNCTIYLYHLISLCNIKFSLAKNHLTNYQLGVKYLYKVTFHS